MFNISKFHGICLSKKFSVISSYYLARWAGLGAYTKNSVLDTVRTQIGGFINVLMGYNTVHFKPLIIPMLLFSFLGCASPKENMVIGRETRGLLKNTKNICVITAFIPSEFGQLDQSFIISEAIDILRNNGIDAIGKKLPINKSVWVGDYTPAQTIIQRCFSKFKI